MKKICPRCGSEFDCVHSTDCWCVKIKFNKKADAYLKAHYSDCLCEKCLKEIAHSYD